MASFFWAALYINGNDDTQIYGFCRPGDTDSLRKRVTDCVAAVADWMRSNRLQLNASKTEVLWCASARRQSQLPSDPLAVGLISCRLSDACAISVFSLTALHLATWPQIFSASHLNARRRLRSSTTSALVAPRTVHYKRQMNVTANLTIGDRTFLAATAASVWNSLPESVRSSPSLQVFRSRLKTELFARSYNHD